MITIAFIKTFETPRIYIFSPLDDDLHAMDIAIADRSLALFTFPSHLIKRFDKQ